MTVTFADVVRVSAVWNIAGGSQCVNVFHVLAGAPGDVYDDEEFANACAFWLDAMYNDSQVTNCMPNNVIADRVDFFNVTQGAAMPTLNGSTGLNGLLTTPMLPVGTAALVVGRTAVPRRVGRKFLPPFATQMVVDDGSWNSDARNALTAFASVWKDEFVYENPSPEALNVTLRAVVGSEETLTFSPIMSAVGRSVPAYQRRRKPGIGS